MRDSIHYSSSPLNVYTIIIGLFVPIITLVNFHVRILLFIKRLRGSTPLRAISSLANKHELRMVKCIFLLLAVPFLGSTIFILYYLYVSFHYPSETMASSNDRKCTSFYIDYFFYVKKNYIT